ncbi:hypothetical protein [Stenotrophomonas sp. NPDC077659]|uniref:hypothetical protein n=1 Tax=Stenotrophomonas sp. NPDC077659 TaxID=3390694 RepID=UPI003CFEE725
MDERRLGRLYLSIAVVFGLPGLLTGGVGACMAVVMGVLGLASLQPDKLWFGAAMFAWGTVALAGLVAWVALSIALLRNGRRGLHAASPGWWWLLGLGMLACLPMLAMALYYFFEPGISVLAALLAGPTVLVPAGVLVLLRLRSQAPDLCR